MFLTRAVERREGEELRVRKRAYGWHRDLPDHRDHLYVAPGEIVRKPPHRVGLPEVPRIHDQGGLQSCTANAVAAAIQFMPAPVERSVQGKGGGGRGAKQQEQAGPGPEILQPMAPSLQTEA